LRVDRVRTLVHLPCVWLVEAAMVLELAKVQNHPTTKRMSTCQHVGNVLPLVFGMRDLDLHPAADPAGLRINLRKLLSDGDQAPMLQLSQ
jgi:hypothetical protein